MNPVFEFDEAKSASNKEKHGIDFVESQGLWSAGLLLELPAKSLDDEQRWVAFYTLRNEIIRLISVRKARPREIEYYESQRTRQDF